MKYEFTSDELKQIDQIKARYPEVKPATLPVLWMAQDKFGHVEPEVQKLVAETLDLPEAHVHGVAEFYTQYYKKELGKYVLDVCTCLSCQLCGGYEMLSYLKEKLGIDEGDISGDGLFSIQQVECLGACGYAPMMQITNGVFVNQLTQEKIDKLLDDLREGKLPAFEAMAMPQHEKGDN